MRRQRLGQLTTTGVLVTQRGRRTKLGASDAVREGLRDSAFVIWLRTDLHVLAERLINPQTRPLSGDIGVALARQDHDREALYASIADIVVDTTAKDAHQTLEKVIGRIVR